MNKEYKNENMVRNVKDYKRFTIICDNSWERLLRIRDMYSDKLAHEKMEYNLRRDNNPEQFHEELKGKNYSLSLKMTIEERKQMMKDLGVEYVKDSRGRLFYIV